METKIGSGLGRQEMQRRATQTSPCWGVQRVRKRFSAASAVQAEVVEVAGAEEALERCPAPQYQQE